MNIARNGRLNVVVLLIAALSSGASAQNGEQSYAIRVEGMVCAYCAYSVSKNLATLPTVIADSVLVDLERGVATFKSTQPLDDSLIDQTFRDSGFKVIDVSVIAELQDPPTLSTRVVTLTFENGQIGSTMADHLLDVLGEAASKGTSEFRVVAPQELESKILRPLIAGRQKAVRIRYESAEQGAVEVTLYQHSEVETKSHADRVVVLEGVAP